MKTYDVIIIGAGAAGLFCALTAGQRGRQVLVLDHANKPGKKILMSGGGRCNFTNLDISPEKFISHNPHFCKSALSQYTQWDFIDLVNRHHIAHHEKTLGQLFCDTKARVIVEMLLTECRDAGVTITLNTAVNRIEKQADNHYILTTASASYHCQSLVIATGGLSIPTMGASPFGYKIAEQFGLPVYPTRAGLVPLTWQDNCKKRFEPLAGVAAPCFIHNDDISFQESMLFTHRGLSGPAILQISSYWQAGTTLTLNLTPSASLSKRLQDAREKQADKSLKTILAPLLPKRLLHCLLGDTLINKAMKSLQYHEIESVITSLERWEIKPNGTEGYRTAEVTLGGVDTNCVSSKTFETHKHKGLYFIGEVLDVTGWLGGYNFQWAWSSGWCAGKRV